MQARQWRQSATKGSIDMVNTGIEGLLAEAIREALMNGGFLGSEGVIKKAQESARREGEAAKRKAEGIIDMTPQIINGQKVYTMEGNSDG